jgi:CRISPR-associated protein Csh1
MIHQFVELGDFYRNSEGIDNDLAQYAHDPEQAFRSRTVSVIVFSEAGYEGIQIEEYDPAHRLWYLFRPGASNGYEPTGTTAMPRWDPKQPEDFGKRALTKLNKRLAKSAQSALGSAQGIDEWERVALTVFGNIGTCATKIIEDLATKHSDPKEGGIITLGWRTLDGQLRRVGDFDAFRQSLVAAGRTSAFAKKSAAAAGWGQCSICGAPNVRVGGLLRIEQFKFYSTDKPGAISGGFDESRAWRNFPACESCSEKAQFSGERLKKNLTFDYYGFQYLVLPSVVQPSPTIAHELLDRLCRARVNRVAAARLTDAEDELLWAVAQEQNLLQLDLLFYDPRGRSFRPALHVSGLLPSHFRALFEARDRVDAHPWLSPDSSKNAFEIKTFSFGMLREVLPEKFSNDFLEATRAAFMRRHYGVRTLLRIGIQTVRQKFLDGENWEGHLGRVFASLLFFDELVSTFKGDPIVNVQYGDSPQADRVRRVLNESRGALRESPEAQAAFLTAACCRRIEHIQKQALGSSPFREKYKGLKLAQKDVCQLFVEATAKAQAYEDQEQLVSGLLACTAEAFRACPDVWSIAPDEVSYNFALGLALASRLAKGSEDQEDGSGAQSIESN